MIKTAVIGHPISHSKSPLIHNHWIKQNGLEGEYTAIDIAPENLKDGIEDLGDQGFAGFNVTVPHKEAIYDLCDDLGESAEAIGAVNTVVIREGKLYGENTDAFGFTQNLRAAEETFGHAWELTAGPAMILGAGGAARAALYGLLQYDIEQIFITNRTQEKAEKLAEMNPDRVTVIPWDEKEQHLSGLNLLANTTSLGMSGKDPLVMDFESASPDLVVHDIVYAPLYTDLLKSAREFDLRVVTGIGMLLHQARPAFQMWYGVMPDVSDELEDMVLS